MLSTFPRRKRRSQEDPAHVNAAIRMSPCSGYVHVSKYVWIEIKTNKQTRYVTQVAHMIYDADDGAGCGDGSEWFNQTVLAEKQSR